MEQSPVGSQRATPVPAPAPVPAALKSTLPPTLQLLTPAASTEHLPTAPMPSSTVCAPTRPVFYRRSAIGSSTASTAQSTADTSTTHALNRPQLETIPVSRSIGSPSTASSSIAVAKPSLHRQPYLSLPGNGPSFLFHAGRTLHTGDCVKLLRRNNVQRHLSEDSASQENTDTLAYEYDYGIVQQFYVDFLSGEKMMYVERVTVRHHHLSGEKSSGERMVEPRTMQDVSSSQTIEAYRVADVVDIPFSISLMRQSPGGSNHPDESATVSAVPTVPLTNVAPVPLATSPLIPLAHEQRQPKTTRGIRLAPLSLPLPSSQLSSFHVQPPSTTLAVVDTSSKHPSGLATTTVASSSTPFFSSAASPSMSQPHMRSTRKRTRSWSHPTQEHGGPIGKRAMLLKTVFVQAVGGAADPQLAVSAPGDMRRLPSVASGGDGSSATGDGFDGMTATPMTASRDQLEAEAAAALLDMCKGTSNVHTSK